MYVMVHALHEPSGCGVLPGVSQNRFEEIVAEHGPTVLRTLLSHPPELRYGQTASDATIPWA